MATKLGEVFICPKRRKFTQIRTAPVDAVVFKKKKKEEEKRSIFCLNISEQEQRSCTLFSKETQFDCRPLTHVIDAVQKNRVMQLASIKYSWDPGLRSD